MFILKLTLIILASTAVSLRLGWRLGEFCWAYWTRVFKPGFGSMNMCYWREREETRSECRWLFFLYPWTVHAAKRGTDYPLIGKWFDSGCGKGLEADRKERYLRHSAWVFPFRLVWNVCMIIRVVIHFTLTRLGRASMRLYVRMARGPAQEEERVPEARARP